jgi:hypothetical protein
MIELFGDDYKRDMEETPTFLPDLRAKVEYIIKKHFCQVSCETGHGNCQVGDSR